MRSAVLLPNLGARGVALRVSCWLSDLGDPIQQGDRLVEILADGIAFDVSAETSGVLARIERSLDAIVEPGDVLGWIETGEEQA